MPDSQQPDESLPPERVDAGLRAAFHSADSPDSNSVLKRIEARSGALRRLSLPEPAEEVDPVLRRVRAERGTPSASRYQVLGELAQGGVGIVMRGRDVDLGRDVAIKVIHERFRDDREILQRFVEEAQIGGQLQHPGIVPVYELGVQPDDRPFFTMKLVKGDTLAVLLEKRKGLSDDRLRLLGLFEQVCQTMAYAHARRVVHRDLKPSNVMVGAFGEVQVVDWGFAKVLQRGGLSDEQRGADPESRASVIETVRSDGTGSRSVVGSVLGTPAYMPPEQAHGDVERMDERSDVFALGAILCEILTGDPPYTSADGADLLGQAARCDMTRPLARLEECGVDSGLVEIVRSCLLASRQARPRDAKELAERVAQYLGSTEERAREAQLKAAAARARAKLSYVLAAMICLVILLVVWGYTWIEREREEQALHAARRVETLMDDAVRLGGRAEVAGLDSAPLWDDAVAAGRRALDTSRTEDSGEELRDRARDLLAALERDGRQAEVDRRLLRELLDVRMPLPHSFWAKDPRGWELSRQDHGFAAAFRDYCGVDLETLAPAEATRRLQGNIEVELATALDWWAVVRRQAATVDADRETDPGSWRHLVRIARQLGPEDPWRNRLRDELCRSEPDTRALRELSSATALVRLSPADLVLLAELLQWAGDEPAAQWVCEEGLRLHPQDFWLHYRRGLVLATMKPPRVEEGLHHLRTARALRPDVLQVAHFEGIFLGLSGDHVGAEVVFDDLARLEPGNTHWLGHRCEIYAKTGRLAEATATAHRILRLDPDHLMGHYGLGLLHLQSGAVEASFEAFTRALEVGPEMVFARVGLADAHRRRGDYEKALEVLPTRAQLVENPLRPSLPRWPYLSGERWPETAEALAESERGLRAIVEGELEASSAVQLLEAAHFAQLELRSAASTRLYREAFAADPALAEQYRVNAAASAVLADHRQEAREWLEADLDLWTGRLERGDVDLAKGFDVSTAWLRHGGLARVRDEAGLDELSAEEARAWRTSWSRLLALRSRLVRAADE